jgi:hypothetical protein
MKFDELMNIPDNPPPPREFLYLLSKASTYRKIGAAAYRVRDAFHMPEADWPDEILAAVDSGMEQITRFKGYQMDNPFEGLGISGFYALLRTLHFTLEGQAAGRTADGHFLDTMRMVHCMTGEQITLYNKVPVNPGEED